MGFVFGDDRGGMAGAMSVNMFDGCIQVIDNSDCQNEIEEFSVPVFFAGCFNRW